MNDPFVTENPQDNAPEGDAFYDPPVLRPEGLRGDPIYQRPLPNDHSAALADGENWLVLYRSQDATGFAVATSGIIVLPRTEPPEGGFPLISWAHGTVGVADRCAPSRDTPESGAHSVNRYPHTLLNAFLGKGWAVAMTDYEGLGVTDRRHPYLLGASEAAGVLDIVRTAHCLFGARISNRFAIVGHSQGGQAALFAASHAPAWLDEQTTNPELALVAVAAIAPANHLLGVIRFGAKQPAPSDGYAFTPLLLCGAMAGAVAEGKSIDPGQVLSDIAYPQYWEQVDHLSRAELSDAETSWGGLNGNQQFRGGYPDDPNEHQVLFDAHVSAMNPNLTLTVPVRITQAADDDRVKADYPLFPVLKGTDDLIAELRETNPALEPPLIYERIPKGRVVPDPELKVHFGTINHDLTDLINWLRPYLEPTR